MEVRKEINFTDDREGRAICGMSDGGLCAFNAAWQRPEALSKVVSHIGSYTRLRQGSDYPYLIRNTGGNPKPIRVFLQDGSNDINITEGNWTLANLAMASALMYARYDYRFELGTGVTTLSMVVPSCRIRLGGFGAITRVLELNAQVQHSSW